jgi:hypothetical protein
VLQWVFGRFWAIFKAQFYRPHLRAGLIGLALAVPLVVGLYLWNDHAKDRPRPGDGIAAPGGRESGGVM